MFNFAGVVEVSKMRKQKWVVGALALALATGAGSIAYSQPNAEAPVAKAGKQGRAGKGARAGRAGKGMRGARGPVQQQIRQLESALGAPLTDQQKQDIEAAHKTYMENVAKSVGLTPEQLQDKMKEARQKQRAERGDKAGKAAKQ